MQCDVARALLWTARPSLCAASNIWSTLRIGIRRDALFLLFPLDVVVLCDLPWRLLYVGFVIMTAYGIAIDRHGDCDSTGLARGPLSQSCRANFAFVRNEAP